jgi:glucose/arabinose dehydrogenase
MWALALGSVILTAAACGESARLSLEAGMGPDPALPDPNPTLLPTVNIAPAEPWPPGSAPVAADGLTVSAYASDLDHPRWLYVLPNGDVLVAETNAPERPDDGKGIQGWFMRKVMGRAGATVPSANRITLLRDADGDGQAEVKSAFLEGLNSPFGMTLVDRTLYVANTDAVMSFEYEHGATRVAGPGSKVVDLPAGTINHHWTKNIIANGNGSLLYVTSGSNSNIAENGMENEVNRAAILEIDPGTRQVRLFASGLRNPNGLAWEPVTGELWTTVNERDGLGSDLVPDYMTAVKRNGFYGWPYSYYGQTVDERVEPQRADLVATAIKPDYALGPHTGSLGLAFYEGDLLPARYRGGAFVAQHGSWNREPLSGYRVIFVPFANGRPAGTAEEVLTGFVSADEKAHGRPVGVAVDRRGGVLVADDVGNVIWRLGAESSTRISVR